MRWLGDVEGAFSRSGIKSFVLEGALKELEVGDARCTEARCILRGAYNQLLRRGQDRRFLQSFCRTIRGIASLLVKTGIAMHLRVRAFWLSRHLPR